MNYQDLRITKLRSYLINVIDTLTSNNKYQINAYMLSNDINNYSLDKIPTETEVEQWIIGPAVKKDIYSFRSRMSYSQDTINNLKNIGFFEKFEQLIKSNNENGVLPEIENIESIKCLNCGTMNNAETKTAEFDIQIQITYRESMDGDETSL